MRKQLTVPYEEIENRLAICCEFLLDRKKSIEDAYESLMEKLGTKLMEYSEFKYWFKRFQNNQFDLGYDTSQDEDTVVGIPSGAQIVDDNESETPNDASKVNIDLGDSSQDCKEMSEIRNTVVPVETVERKTSDLKLNHQFNESDVPQIFQTLINDRMNGLRSVSLDLDNALYWLKFDDLNVRFEKKTDNWTVTYSWRTTTESTTIKTADPEKFIVDHLWFVLKNPNLKLEELGMYSCENSKTDNRRNVDSEKMNTLLQSMFNTFDHQIHTNRVSCERFNEDTFLSILKCIKPERLVTIGFNFSWKQEGNYQELKEIMRTDQWKQANKIFSTGITPLRVEDLFQCEHFILKLKSVTQKDVLSVTEHFFNSTDRKHCTLISKNQNFDINVIIDFLHAKIDGSEVIGTFQIDPQNKRGFKIVKSTKCVFLYRYGSQISIVN